MIETPDGWEHTRDESGQVNGLRVKGYKSLETSGLSTTKMRSEGGSTVSYTVASNKYERDSGVQGMIRFESETEMESVCKGLEDGADSLWVCIRGPQDEPTLAWVHIKTIRGVRFRLDGDGVVVESLVDGATKKVPVLPPLGTSNIVRVQTGKSPKREWDTLAGEYEEMSFAEFVKKRERRRAKEESSIVPNRSDHLTRSIFSRASRETLQAQTEKVREDFEKKESLAWVFDSDSPKEQDGKKSIRGKKRLRLDPAKAYEVVVGLSPYSRSFAASITSNGKSKKTEARVEAEIGAILPFDENAIQIDGGTNLEIAIASIESAYLESVYRALDERHLQVWTAIFDEAYRRGGSFVLDRKGIVALAEKMGIGLKKASYSGAELKALRETIDNLSRFTFNLEIRQKENGAIRVDAPILQWEYTETKVDKDENPISQERIWRVNEKVLDIIRMGRHLALVDRSFYLLNAQKQTWEIRAMLYIASRWSKGWLGREKFSKVEGRFETTVGRLLHGSGLSLAANNLLEFEGRPALRKKVVQVFENLRRCGPDRVEAIGDYGIEQDPQTPDDPLQDRVWIRPSEGQVEQFRERIMGRAEVKMLEGEVVPPKRRGRPRKKDGDKSPTP
jgi:hypothetical protein